MATTFKNLVLALLIAGIILLAGCSSASSVSNPPPVQTPSQPANPPPTQQGSGSGQTASASNVPAAAQPQTTTPSLKTEVIYTHMSLRCVTCLCFESRIKWVVDTYFKGEISSGKLTFRIINAQETKNAALVKKLGVVGSQLFVNTIIDGADHIKNIEEIWYWKCNDDPPGFNEKVRSVIAQSLEGKI